MKPKPTPQRLSELLDYDQNSGVLTWKQHRPNGSKAMSRAGSVSKHNCLRVVGIDGAIYAEHRVIWAIVHGSWPTMQIDHINGEEADNRLVNLREVSGAMNCQNKRRAPSTSSHGVLGASKSSVNSWRAQIKVNGKKLYLGSFKTSEEANTAYLSAKRSLHPGCAF